MVMLSFGSARAVKLRLTPLVFLMNRCHRILDTRRICSGVAGYSAGFPQPWRRSLFRYRFAFVYLCVINVGQTLWNSKLHIVELR